MKDITINVKCPHCNNIKTYSIRDINEKYLETICRTCFRIFWSTAFMNLKQAKGTHYFQKEEKKNGYRFT